MSRNGDRTLLRAFDDMEETEELVLTPGQVLIREGDHSDRVYVLVEGRLVVSHRVDSRDTRLALIQEPGSVIGEMVALAGGRRTATVTADETSTVLSVGADALREKLDNDHELAKDVAALATRRAEEVELAELLSAHFGIDDPTSLMEITGNVTWRNLATGEVLITEGDEAKAIYFVVKGRLVVTGADPASGEQTTFREVGRGDVVGELGVLSGELRSANVTAKRQSTVAEMSDEHFFELIERHPRLMVGVGLRAIKRYEGRRWQSAPTSVVGVVADPEIDLEPIIGAFITELSPHGEVARLSQRVVEQALGSPGIANAEVGSPAEVRLSRYIYETELSADYVVVEIGTEESRWANRAAGLVDRMLVVVEPSTPAQRMAQLKRLAESSGEAPRTLVVVRRDTEAPEATHALKQGVAADTAIHILRGDPTSTRRLARLAVGRGQALVLSGGGARGFAHIGVYRALVENGFEVDLVGGTSMGGIIAAVIAHGMTPDEMTAWASRYFPTSLDYTIPIVSMTRGARIARYASLVFGERHIEDLPIPYFAMATDLTASRQHVFETGSVVTAMRATSSIPGVMPPVPFDGRLLVDGGILNNLPSDVARARAPDGVVVAVDVAPPKGPSAHADYGLSVSATQALTNAVRRGKRYPQLSAVLMRTMIAASMRQRDLTVAEGIADLYLALDMRGVSMLDFDQAENVARRGYEAAAPQVEEWLRQRNQ